MSRTDYELSVSYPSGEGLDPKDRDNVLARYVLEADGFAGLREGERPETGALSGWDKRWDPDEDLIPLSRQHPEILFTLWGQNEEDEGPFTTYYLGGRLQHEVAEVRIAPFDPSKLL